jgi:hypothetical protein
MPALDVPALQESAPFVRAWDNEIDWEAMISLSRLVSHLGLVYVCFGYIEASCSRQMGHQPIIFSIGVALTVEMALAAAWICELGDRQRTKPLYTELTLPS